MNLDNSWSTAVEYAYLNRIQFGPDFLFSYGPLGFLGANSSQSHLFVQRIVFALVWSLAVAVSATGLCRRMPTVSRLLFLAWFFIFSYAGQLEQHVYLVLGYGIVLLAADSNRRFLVMAATTAFFAIISLVKFTFLIASCAALALCIVLKLTEKRWTEAAAIAAFFSAFFLAAWVSAGQKLTNIYSWLIGSLQITSGYNMAMSMPPRKAVLIAGVAAIGLNFIAVAYMLWKSDRNRRLLFILAILQLFVFFTWKYGFVRADDHVLFSVSALPLIIGIYLVREPWLKLAPEKPLVAIYLGILVLCLSAAELQRPGFILKRISTWHTSLIRQGQDVATVISGNGRSLLPIRLPAQIPLPVISEKIGNAPVDLMNFNQLLLMANGLNYQPRPVIQGYSAYTPYLQQLNSAYLNRKPDLPYLVLHHMTIDNRFPTLDDSAAFNYALTNYRPVAQEEGLLLLGKYRSDQPRFNLIYQKSLRSGETLDLSGWNDAPLFASVNLESTVAGRVSGLLYQQPPLSMTVNSSSGAKVFRFVPAMAKLPFLLNPLVASNDDLLSFYSAERGTMVNAMSFVVPDSLVRQYEDRIEISLYRLARTN